MPQRRDSGEFAALLQLKVPGMKVMVFGGVFRGMLKSCRLCPRRCGVDRTIGQKGFCGEGLLARVAKACLHRWEEPCISGTAGSGTLFFSGCNMRCLFCQNHPISQGGVGAEVSAEELCVTAARLLDRGPHNLNLVSPSHFLPQAAEMLARLRTQRRITVVWNSNGYESVEAIRSIDGLVDVYLPDLKYRDDRLAMELSSAPGYFAAATAAILEMLRQVGEPVFDELGVIRRGLVVRHLVLPGHTRDSVMVLRWIASNLPKGVYVSLMAQYCPSHRARGIAGLNRALTQREYDEVLDEFFRLGLENGYCQEISSATQEYTPSFDMEGVVRLPDSGGAQG